MSGPTRYVLGRRVGSGGMAEVFEAAAHGVGAFSRRVAVKRLRAEMLSVPEARGAFFDEATIASVLHHANIVSIVDYGMVDGLPFQVFELVEGFNMRDLRTAIVNSGRAASAELALSIGLSIAHALAYAHELVDENGAPRRIVHRDVSPQNILISWSGDVKLADFGVAAATKRTEKTATGFIKGNPSYMAPEQARAEAVDAHADVFALGCVLHWFLRGASPIEGARSLNAVISGADPLIDSAIDSDIAALLSDATRASTKKRTPNMRVLLEQLASSLASRGVADPRAIVLDELLPLKDARAPHPIEDLFRPLIVFDGEEEGLRRFRSVAGTPPGDDTASEDTQTTSPSRSLPSRGDAIATGAKLGGLVLMEKISEGGFAAIYRAEHPVIGRQYAVKVLHRSVDTSHNRQRLEREARALARVRHPHVLSVVDFGVTEGGLPFLVTELVEGTTLRNWVLYQGAADLSQILEIGAQLAGALVHIHELGLVHRDLKPSNVIIESERPLRVKLIDFGIARLVSLATNESHLTSADQILGTPSYMPPEQIRDPAKSEPRSDLYALGCLLFFLAEGRAPFEGSRAEVLALQLEASPPPVRFEGLDALVSRLMAKDVGARPASAADVFGAIGVLARSTVTDVLPDRPRLAEPAVVVRPRAPIAGPWAIVATVSAIVFALLWMKGAVRDGGEVPLLAVSTATATPSAPVRARARAADAVQPDVEVTRDAPRSRARRAARVPLSPSRETPEEARSPELDLDAELQSRGLSRAELSHYAELNGERSADTILAAVDTAAVPKTLLSARLDEDGTRLAACATKTCERSSEVESEYLEVRIAAARSGDGRALLLRTAKLLARARRL